MTEQVERILPLPYLPTYIARRPKKLEITEQNFYPIFATNWQKASDNYAEKHRSFYNTPFINIELETNDILPKQFDTYKQYDHSQMDVNSSESLNRIRPFTVPNHITRTSQNWSRFLDEYSDRFKINYPLPNDESVIYSPSRPGRYPYRFDENSSNIYSGLKSRIEPVTNPFRNIESKQKSTVTHPIWIPYGTAPRRYQKLEKFNKLY